MSRAWFLLGLLLWAHSCYLLPECSPWLWLCVWVLGVSMSALCVRTAFQWSIPRASFSLHDPLETLSPTVITFGGDGDQEFIELDLMISSTAEKTSWLHVCFRGCFLRPGQRRPSNKKLELPSSYEATRLEAWPHSYSGSEATCVPAGQCWWPAETGISCAAHGTLYRMEFLPCCQREVKDAWMSKWEQKGRGRPPFVCAEGQQKHLMNRLWESSQSP